jgi:hypothetical protein
MRITITLDLNALQYESIRQIAQRYPHGWHTADLVIRRDAVEKRYEADWVKDVARAVAAELASPSHQS